ncbi:MAG: hypothetical protein M5U33_02170 [Pseudorhodoplanes sp.]|nr:hypothetical protein [Pseudorhodoplanes sp.]
MTNFFQPVGVRHHHRDRLVRGERDRQRGADRGHHVFGRAAFEHGRQHLHRPGPHRGDVEA